MLCAVLLRFFSAAAFISMLFWMPSVIWLAVMKPSKKRQDNWLNVLTSTLGILAVTQTRWHHRSFTYCWDTYFVRVPCVNPIVHNNLNSTQLMTAACADDRVLRLIYVLNPNSLVVCEFNMLLLNFVWKQTSSQLHILFAQPTSM